nr:hypothetical protein GCM10020063_027610 [Dactylosporangium thailandense]
MTEIDRRRVLKGAAATAVRSALVQVAGTAAQASPATALGNVHAVDGATGVTVGVADRHQWAVVCEQCEDVQRALDAADAPRLTHCGPNVPTGGLVPPEFSPVLWRRLGSVHGSSIKRIK